MHRPGGLTGQAVLAQGVAATSDGEAIAAERAGNPERGRNSAAHLRLRSRSVAPSMYRISSPSTENE